MTLIEAIKFCEDYECEVCPANELPDCRTNFEKQDLHYPCCINLVDEDERNALKKEWRSLWRTQKE